MADAVCEVGNDGSARGRRECCCQNGDGRFAGCVELARWTSFALLWEARRGWTADGTDLTRRRGGRGEGQDWQRLEGRAVGDGGG